MKRELNKIFDVQSREARRDILDKFDLTAEDKNKVLNKINSGGCDNDKIIYYELNNLSNFELSNIRISIIAMCAQIKTIVDSVVIFATAYAVLDENIRKNIIACAFIPTNLGSNGMMIYSLEELIDENNKTNPDSAFEASEVIKRRITAEEYWDITKSRFTIAMNAREFTGSEGNYVEGAGNIYVIKEYKYEFGMTFEQWTQSKYNVDGFIIENEYIRAECIKNGNFNINVVMKDYIYITPETKIDDIVLYNVDEENGGNVYANLRALVPEV